jgi:hypothetical protein
VRVDKPLGASKNAVAGVPNRAGRLRQSATILV